MKNIVKFTTVVAFMFATVAGMAKEPKLNVLTNGKAKSMVLTMEASLDGAYVSLMDNQYNVIYSEKIVEGVFAKKFNLDQLADGVYYLTADEAMKSYSYTIKIANNTVTLLNTAEDIKPFFRKTNNMIYMNYLNLDESSLKIKVYDSSDRIVFSQEVEDEMIVEKAFNFTDAYSGTYTLVVYSDNGTYTEEFVVN